MRLKGHLGQIITLLSILALCFVGVAMAAPVSPNAPSQAALKQASHWRQILLNKGGAGLYASLNLPQLAQQAGLSAESAKHLAKLDDLLVATPPTRARLYRVTHHDNSYWVARLDYPHQQLNFLRLKTNAKGQLIDWYDYSLGIWLSQLLVQSQTLHATQMAVMTHQLAKHPMRLLDTVSPSSAIARLILPACQQLQCYRQALAKLTLATNEVSLFALDKAALDKNPSRIQQQAQQLEQQLGQDPAVTWLLATTAIQADHCQKAINIVKPALAHWPAAIRLYPLASQCYMTLKKPKKALNSLLSMQRETGAKINWDALLKKPLYRPLKTLIND